MTRPDRPCGRAARARAGSNSRRLEAFRRGQVGEPCLGGRTACPGAVGRAAFPGQARRSPPAHARVLLGGNDQTSRRSPEKRVGSPRRQSGSCAGGPAQVLPTRSPPLRRNGSDRASIASMALRPLPARRLPRSAQSSELRTLRDRRCAAKASKPLAPAATLRKSCLARERRGAGAIAAESERIDTARQGWRVGRRGRCLPADAAWQLPFRKLHAWSRCRIARSVFSLFCSGLSAIGSADCRRLLLCLLLCKNKCR